MYKYGVFIGEAQVLVGQFHGPEYDYTVGDAGVRDQAHTTPWHATVMRAFTAVSINDLIDQIGRGDAVDVNREDNGEPIARTPII